VQDPRAAQPLGAALELVQHGGGREAAVLPERAPPNVDRLQHRSVARPNRMPAPSSHPYIDPPGPVAIAHRGGAEEAPENTLPAFEATVGLRYRYLETDAHATRDGVVVAFHDAQLDRVTDRTGAIGELTIDDVEGADAGHSHSRDGGHSFPLRSRGIRVPRLEQLLLRLPAARFNIDPKSDRCVLPLVALIERAGDWERVCIGAFSDRRLRRVRSLSGGRACTSMGPLAISIARALAASGLMARQGADCIQVPLHRGPLRIVDERFVRAAHRARLPIHVWTVNDETTMHVLLDLGVDGIMTDRLRLLRQVFAARGLPLAGGTARRGPRC
jgi:glycerophosphoryl diester phosphodiesterase